MRPSGSRAAQIRARLGHPVIDADAHTVEFLPAVQDHLAELAGPSIVESFDRALSVWTRAREMSADARRGLGLARTGWWVYPARNSLDRATAMLPRLLYERLDEIGIDFAMVFPTCGQIAMSLDDAEVRRAATRAFNRYHAEEFREYGDRLRPVALIPTHSPAEAIDELDYSVGELGFRAVLLAGPVLRPLPGENTARAARWLDVLALDSPFDYDPVWARCAALGVAPLFHRSAMGWGGRASPSNYIFNHLGSFAAGSDAMCRALFMGGVVHRFPELRFGFLEGGVNWACGLYADLVAHWRKRSAEGIEHYNPAQLDRAQLEDLFKRYGSNRFTAHLGELDASLRVLSDPDEDPESLDEFARCGIERVEDIRDVFVERFHFGCEADDPLNAAAFDGKRNPYGARLRPLLGSDIGHWDLADIAEVLVEANELVEKGLLDERDFRDLTFANAVHLWSGANPNFFAGTTVEAEAKESVG